MKIRNKLKYWRHYLQIDSQTKFAELLGVSRFSINQWENQKKQPSLDTLCRVFAKLKKEIPELHMEDLIDYKPDE